MRGYGSNLLFRVVKFKSMLMKKDNFFLMLLLEQVGTSVFEALYISMIVSLSSMQKMRLSGEMIMYLIVYHA